MLLVINMNQEALRPGVKSIFQSLYQQFLESSINKTIPPNLILFLVELYFVDREICEIVFLVSDNLSYMCQQETYSNCIYWQYSNSLSKIIVINNVKERTGYSMLEPRVNSEMFIEIPIDAQLHMILNAEFSGYQVTRDEKKWFGDIIETLGFHVGFK
ncbi:MAG: hypothetical protein GTO45_38340 [Candidatus Aminicenantes bacterium]|nr:hypothetical protein [Candidatus Aminicenantes bacterium]NIM84485.1 hypothetical protein [Candidatus Aminicenantes bacterium]NIN24006.1 hypothetical protein [Candidatus Aminicenantes bacterium]NIN47720.1 hypothetical protein [Candidatus Aminicenantes bacterium]NIN90650.1 hypothetical protein [Candidatus Aminicenantes bacterium]